MWQIIIVVALLVCAIGIIYLWNRMTHFSIFQTLIEKKKWLGIIVSGLPLLLFIPFFKTDPVNTVIVIIHLIVFWLFSDLIGFIYLKLSKKTYKRYFQGVLALLITTVYLGAGWYFAHHVVETDYVITTTKDIGQESLRIVQISDSHLGATFQSEGFIKHLHTIQKTNPDIIVVTGDYVDDDSKKVEMEKATKALGQMKTTYGIYYIFGNHDKGYFQYRDFTTKDLVNTLEENHITVLEDENVLINNQFYLIGRQDRSETDRATCEDLLKDIDTSKYMIMLDHQPHDFDEQARLNIDLVLSGHTHGGQMIPIGWTGEISGANDKTYGLEKRNHTLFIVNSGISDWAIKFKTGTIAEFGVIDIKMEDTK